MTISKIFFRITYLLLSNALMVNSYNVPFFRSQRKACVTTNQGTFAVRHRRKLCLTSSSSDEDDLSWLNPPDSSETLSTEASSYDNGRDPNDMGDVVIPSTGVSVTDELDEANADKFVSEFVPIKGVPGVAQIVTAASSWSFDPVRYLVALSPPLPKALPPSEGDEPVETPSNEENKMFVMTDIPPISDVLVANMKKYMGPNGRLAAILVTSRDAIHYDEAPAVFTTRKSDIDKWEASFPGVEIVVYRLDIPRDCRESVTQRLDGYGPWALDESNTTFIETGRPLSYVEWDDETAANVMENGQTPPDDDDQLSDDHMYTPDAIREREEGKRVLAVYTPGHTFGSVSYIFPETKVCVSGFTIPVEDNREEENEGIGGAGPALDARGYIATSKAGLGRQMESARDLINTYGDRFTVVLPARGDPLYLDGTVEERKSNVLEIIEQYDKIGKIYEELGITSDK